MVIVMSKEVFQVMEELAVEILFTILFQIGKILKCLGEYSDSILIYSNKKGLS